VLLRTFTLLSAEGNQDCLLKRNPVPKNRASSF
jgi:hypothetical protein